ncbi:hypothetical protein [Candidatus Entotheonella palauensis]|nr:hypothetical protein [Candidatus Entotheonella palauensis]
MINRGAVILKYREPAICWVNEAGPYVDNPGITLDGANRERTVSLMSDEDAES